MVMVARGATKKKERARKQESKTKKINIFGAEVPRAYWWLVAGGWCPKRSLNMEYIYISSFSESNWTKCLVYLHKIVQVRLLGFEFDLDSTRVVGAKR